MGFVIAGFASTYFTVILPGFQMLFVITGSSLERGVTVPSLASQQISSRTARLLLCKTGCLHLPVS